MKLLVRDRLNIVAVVLSIIALLLVFEVIRPFRDLSVDGPLALGAWGIGTALGVVCLVAKTGPRAFSVIAILLNLIPLLAALVLWWILSHSNFAWP